LFSLSQGAVPLFLLLSVCFFGILFRLLLRRMRARSCGERSRRATSIGFQEGIEEFLAKRRGSDGFVARV